MKAKVEVEIDLPALPNFVRMKSVQIEGPVGTTGKGLIDVADLSDDALRALGNDWSLALIEHAKQRREIRRIA